MRRAERSQFKARFTRLLGESINEPAKNNAGRVPIGPDPGARRGSGGRARTIGPTFDVWGVARRADVPASVVI